ncbi:glutamate racemase [Paracidobacterium acidisoli]|uniref:Glutamate racemase n=1 Tax=Paracidobacterium acidisoli TaxID=2303751 RepID=A0A372IKI5_9BACT|nr:glutamate racemase [Paracidobacterium acidisoli]MBT9332770.1 glutamate racemase [Paracidobacterium acidisoli]
MTAAGFDSTPHSETTESGAQPSAPSIGVFDSGFGGLTVLRSLLERIPSASYTYLGDTARLPYGAKSQATVARYAVSSAKFLVEEQGAEYLVIACNTASALALDEIRASVSVPVLGVVETGANAAQASSRTGDVLVVATAATVESHAYAAACRERGLRALEKACPLLVPLVEEGWIDHPVTREVLSIYLSELMQQTHDAGLMPDTLVLGCTHYPLLRPLIERSVPASLHVIDSAEVTAAQVAEALCAPKDTASAVKPASRFFATDSVSKFRALGSRFLGRPIEGVELVNLGG